jgi:hypothetical protein
VYPLWNRLFPLLTVSLELVAATGFAADRLWASKGSVTVLFAVRESGAEPPILKGFSSLLG